MTTSTFSSSAEAFAAVPELLTKERIGDTTGTLCFHITDAGNWTITVADGVATVDSDEPESCDVHITTDEGHWLRIVNGDASARRLFMTGKVKVKGQLALAIRLDKLVSGIRT